MNASLLQKYWINHRINYSIRILITFCCVVLPCWWLGYLNAISPLVLGVISSALAESDGNLSDRFKSLFITLICFCIATFSVEILFPYPLAFVIGLMIATFCFTMLGAIGPRYGNIAFASLLIAIYSMLGAKDSTDFWTQPLLLLIGALSYGITSLIWLALWPKQPIQHNLHQLYLALSRYLKQISKSYYPNEINDKSSNSWLKAIKENTAVVNELNNTKLTLLNRLRNKQPTEINQHFLNIYFIAQDIHERINAIQAPANQLKQHFFHSDIMFRLQHMLIQQSQACKNIAKSLLTKVTYQHRQENILALDELNTSIKYIDKLENKTFINNRLDAIWQNIVQLEQKFEHINKLDNQFNEEDQNLTDNDAHSLKEKMARIVAQLSPSSLLFRHAIRLSLCFFIGHMLIWLLDLPRGYWILITILIVCQPNYSDTHSKLKKRILGTFFGLVLGFIVLNIFPAHQTQIVLVVVFGVLYFTFRSTNYVISTVFITLFVLMSFNQYGNSFTLIFPRMLDTILGCIIAVAAVRYILPDWQAHRMRGIVADAIVANQNYLAQIITQYRLGKRDNLAYRFARREAHQKDTNLSQAISNMLLEPSKYRSAVDESFRFLALNHSMLNFISILGTHRQQINSDELFELVSKVHRNIYETFDKIQESLINNTKQQIDQTLMLELFEQPINCHNSEDVLAKIVLQQLEAITRCQPEMLELAQFLATNALKNSRY